MLLLWAGGCRALQRLFEVQEDVHRRGAMAGPDDPFHGPGFEGPGGPKRAMVAAAQRLLEALSWDSVRELSRPSREIAGLVVSGARRFDRGAELDPFQIRWRFKREILPDVLGIRTDRSPEERDIKSVVNRLVSRARGPSGPIQPAEKPKIIVIVGPTGAGKTHLISRANHDLEDRGGAALVQVDDLERYHPRYKELHLRDDLTAHDLIRPTAKKWRNMLVDHLIAKKYNVVLETAATNVSSTVARIKRFRDAGYEVEIQAVAVPAVQSRLSMIERFVYGRLEDGFGRRVPAKDHDVSYRGTEELLRRAEAEGWADTIRVRNRTEILYENHRGDDGQWSEPPDGWETLSRERDRPLTTEERATIERRLWDVEATVETVMSELQDRVRWGPVAQEVLDFRQQYGFFT